MLTLRFGLYEDIIWATSRYFDEVFENEWITDELSKKMIKDVDNSIVLGDRIIDSPFLGLITPKELSGGVKTLMLINFQPNNIFNGNQLGYNCLKWLLEMCKDKDREVWFGYNPRFIRDTNYGPRDEWFKIRMVSDDGTEEFAYSQRDITNYSLTRIKCEPWDLSEQVAEAQEILRKRDEEVEERYNKLWIERYGEDTEEYDW